jgi:hypothetical protein
MIVMQSPQFVTQDDSGFGDGIAPTPLWYRAAAFTASASTASLDALGIDSVIHDALCRLRVLFHEPEQFVMSTTEFHDLTCFVLHRLLDPTMDWTRNKDSVMPSRSEGVRLATALYLLTVHGPTYFSHAGLQYNLASQLKAQLSNCLDSLLSIDKSLAIWTLSIGLVATSGTPDHEWFSTQAVTAASLPSAHQWQDILPHLKNILWVERQHTEYIFRQAWQCAWASPLSRTTTGSVTLADSEIIG